MYLRVTLRKSGESNFTDGHTTLIEINFRNVHLIGSNQSTE